MGNCTANRGAQDIPDGMEHSNPRKVDCDEIAPLCDVEHWRKNTTFGRRVTGHGTGMNAMIFLESNQHKPIYLHGGSTECGG